MVRAGGWYKRNFIWADVTAAAIVAIAIIAVLWLSSTENIAAVYSAELRHSLYKTVATITGTLTGFTITATALMLNIWEHKSLALLARHPTRSKEIRTVLRNTMWSMVLTMLVWMVAMSIDIGETPCRPIASAVIFATTISIARLCETIWLVQSIATIITRSRNTPPPLMQTIGRRTGSRHHAGADSKR